jgi:hypothetical protein
MFLNSGLEMFKSDHPWLSMAGFWPKRWYPLQTKWSTVAILVFLLLSHPVWENCNVDTWQKSLVFLQWGSGSVISVCPSFADIWKGIILLGIFQKNLEIFHNSWHCKKFLKCFPNFVLSEKCNLSVQSGNETWESEDPSISLFNLKFISILTTTSAPDAVLLVDLPEWCILFLDI